MTFRFAPYNFIDPVQKMLRDLRKTYFYYESESFGGLLRRFFYL